LAVARPEPRPACLTTQDGQLVPQHHDLQLLEAIRARAQEHQSQQTTQHQIAERPEQVRLLRDQRDGTPTPRANQTAGASNRVSAPHTFARSAEEPANTRFDRAGANGYEPRSLLPCRTSWVRAPSSASTPCKTASLGVSSDNG